MDLVSGDPRAAMRALAEGAALVSEPLARKAGLGPGGRLAVRGIAGEVSFPSPASTATTARRPGAALVDLSSFARAFGEGPPLNAALHLAPGVDPEAVVARLRADLRDQALLVRSNRTLRTEVLAIFEETFAVTRLLEAMGLVIAAAGVTLSLLVLARERRAELALYRALGASRPQLAALFLGRGLTLGLVGLALGAMAAARSRSSSSSASTRPSSAGPSACTSRGVGSSRRRWRSWRRRPRRAFTRRSWRAGPRRRSSRAMRSSAGHGMRRRLIAALAATALAASMPATAAPGFRAADPAHRLVVPGGSPGARRLPERVVVLHGDARGGRRPGPSGSGSSSPSSAWASCRSGRRSTRRGRRPTR